MPLIFLLFPSMVMGERGPTNLDYKNQQSWVPPIIEVTFQKGVIFLLKKDHPIFSLKKHRMHRLWDSHPMLSGAQPSGVSNQQGSPL